VVLRRVPAAIKKKSRVARTLLILAYFLLVSPGWMAALDPARRISQYGIWLPDGTGTFGKAGRYLCNDNRDKQVNIISFPPLFPVPSLLRPLTSPKRLRTLHRLSANVHKFPSLW
jgi:hypothetical protein